MIYLIYYITMFVCQIMIKRLFCLLFCLLFSANIFAFELEKDSAYLKGTVDKAIILAHGKDRHPRWLIVEPIRQGVNKQLNWHTLSLQMPTTNSDDWQDYKHGFDDAYNRIQIAINYLKNKGVKTIVLAGHSLGARMMSAFTAYKQVKVDGLIVIACRNNGGSLLSCNSSLANVKIPVLDIYGSENDKDKESAEQREHLISKTYQQAVIDFTGHLFTSSEDELVDVIVEWLDIF